MWKAITAKSRANSSNSCWLCLTSDYVFRIVFIFQEHIGAETSRSWNGDVIVWCVNIFTGNLTYHTGRLIRCEARQRNTLHQISQKKRPTHPTIVCENKNQVLYKGGQMQAETAEAIIKAIRAKASVKYGRARGMSGKGEGAKEYLGYLAQ